MGFIPFALKLGKEKLFSGAPIPLPLAFLQQHDYVIELPDETLLRFRSLICAARSAVHYQLPVTDQTSLQVYSVDHCSRMVNGAPIFELL
jgi:hypothetical protein